jgi:hypothetical protein
MIHVLPLKSYMHSSSSHACYMLCPSHPPSLDNSNYIWRRVQVMKLLNFGDVKDTFILQLWIMELLDLVLTLVTMKHSIFWDVMCTVV